MDEEFGRSGASTAGRGGCGHLKSEVVPVHVGSDVSRLARNNVDWYRLLDLCGLSDTLPGDA